jgi:hypothetical protein
MFVCSLNAARFASQLIITQITTTDFMEHFLVNLQCGCLNQATGCTFYGWSKPGSQRRQKTKPSQISITKAWKIGKDAVAFMVKPFL